MDFFDTSAWLKRYQIEEDSSLIRVALLGAEAVALSHLAYPETRSAMARLVRERRWTAARHELEVARLERHWREAVCIPSDRPLATAAGALAERHALKGADAVHLASALRLSDQLEEPTMFWCFDRSLRRAASEAGLPVAPPVSTSGTM